MHTFNWEETNQIANTVSIRAKNNLVLNLLDYTHIHAHAFSIYRERELILIINNCSLPGNGKVAENVCYEWTTFQQVRNIAYERVGQASTRANENHHYETINDVIAAARSNRDYYNTRLAATTPL